MRTRLSTKGQLIIPKALRDRHGWAAGTELVVEDRVDGVIVRLAKSLPPTDFEDLVGSTGYRGPARSLDDMEAAIARGARRQRRRQRP
jgi:AbrB family looped-hinge helix DNA binding protein